ncbi:hypothetical protein [Corynebacterium sp.]|uniref:hypothetical protein n=1 Tax=Corynebacterium sp. TaxID=1720 RepID=UPI0026DC8B99|nr:hypothetical protein [Corynebacterium sp.]MDO5033140.1 hypothetical protein [Corynebacterium sp.]
MMRTLATLLAGTALVLAGCGSATVEDTGESETVAPLERSSAASTTAGPKSGQASESESESRAASSTEPGAARESASPVPEDRGAHEISEIPTPAGPQGAEQKYLEAVSQGGVDVAGVEDTLIGAAQAVCHDDAVTAPAVAGQLIEQGRTELDHGQLTALITDQARGNVCAN